jgi:hypothetical protein
MSATIARATDVRPLLPVYLVTFVAFIGYAMMIIFLCRC